MTFNVIILFFAIVSLFVIIFLTAIEVTIRETRKVLTIKTITKVRIVLIGTVRIIIIERIIALAATKVTTIIKIVS